MLKILIIGLGSIGRRHLSCLKEIGGVDLAALRTSKGTLKDASEIKEFYTIEDSLSFQPDGVLVANPTSLHVQSALPYLKNGIPVLIEKPIAYSVEDSIALEKYSDSIRIAYCRRFHPINDIVRNIIQKENVFKLGFKRSYYLPKWHPYADYRTEYTAKKELGGGVIRTLSHEIDLMINWFGAPDNTVGVVDKISHLDIDTDDYAFFSCKYEKGFRINFELDFFSPENISTGEMYVEKGKYWWDNENMWFSHFTDVKPTIVHNFTSDVNNIMYVDQMKDFITFILSGISKNATLKEAQQTLEIIEKLDV